MRDFKEELRNMLEQMIRLRDAYEEELAGYPEGTMWRTTVNERNYYYRAFREGDRYIRQSISRDPQMQETLARKAFLRSSLKMLGENIRALSRTLDRFNSLEAEEVIPTLTSAYRDLPMTAFQKPSPALQYSADDPWLDIPADCGPDRGQAPLRAVPISACSIDMTALD